MVSCILLFFALTSLINFSFATYGLDVSSPIDEGTMSCLHRSGYDFVVVRAFRSNGTPDPAAPGTVANAWAAGMAHVDVYMFPCPSCGGARGQVQDLVSFLNQHGVKYGMVWFDIEGPQYWGDVASNIAFMSDLLAEANALGLHVGIYTSESQWGPIMNNWSGGSGYPLWYAHYDGEPNYNDFSPFAGWSSPSIKQFVGDASVCGADIDENWYP